MPTLYNRGPLTFKLRHYRLFVWRNVLINGVSACLPSVQHFTAQTHVAMLRRRFRSSCPSRQDPLAPSVQKRLSDAGTRLGEGIAKATFDTFGCCSGRVGKKWSQNGPINGQAWGVKPITAVDGWDARGGSGSGLPHPRPAVYIMNRGSRLMFRSRTE